MIVDKTWFQDHCENKDQCSIWAGRSGSHWQMWTPFSSLSLPFSRTVLSAQHTTALSKRRTTSSTCHCVARLLLVCLVIYVAFDMFFFEERDADWSEHSLKRSIRAKNDEAEPAPWSTHVRTQFTDHVLDIIFNLNLDRPKTLEVPCTQHYDLIVQNPYSIPNITCKDVGANDWIWCGTMRRIFASNVLPYNLTSVGFHVGDYMDSEVVAHKYCLGNSAEWGKYCVPNMEELQEMNLREGDHDDPKRYRWSFTIEGTNTKPWEERSSMPIFRGTARAHPKPRTPLDLCDNATVALDTLLQAFPNRFAGVVFSADHPDLLDAKFSGIEWTFDTCMKYNATNGLSKVISIERMDPVDYFSDRQVALVLAGIGAAFRLSIHLQYGTAVVLQDYKYVEWFTPYMKPYVHYIPVSEDLHDLEEVLLWVKGHPKEVKQIAENGGAFYEKYLTFYKHEEHIYELLYRLSEYTQFRKDQGLTTILS